MKIMKLPLAELKHPEKNIRIHSERQLAEFERSIKMFGQIRPIVVDEEHTILCGNGLFATLQKMGIDKADVYKIEGLIQNQKKKLMIADNKIYGLGIDDLDTFDSFLQDLKNDLDIPGYDSEILQSMVADADEVTREIAGQGLLDDEEIESIRARGEQRQERLSSVENNVDDLVEDEDNQETLDKEASCQYVTCPDCGCKIWL